MRRAGGARSQNPIGEQKKAPPIDGVEVRAWQLEKGTCLRDGRQAGCVLQQHGADIAQHVAQTLGEARGGSAVDHTVIVGQRQRQH